MMTNFLAVILFILGIVLIVKGADIFIRAVMWLSDVTGWSKAILGATVIAFATSAPEFFVSLLASIKGYGDMSFGNIIGSNIVNLGIGFAIIAIASPHFAKDKLTLFNSFFVLAITAVVFGFALTGFISYVVAVLLIAVFVFFTFVQVKYSKSEKFPRKTTNKKEVALNTAFFVLGIAGVIFGSNIIVDNAKILATAIGISDAIIGLTIVAIGTSLPEIVTTVVALAKKQKAMGVGNIIGSNIFNLGFILASMVFISRGMTITNSSAWIDVPVALLFTLIAVIPTIITRKVHRAQGWILATLYLSYIAVLCVGIAL